MVTVARPNKDAMVRALDIYRDAMRPFIVINLGRRRGSSVPDDLRHRMIEAVRKGHKAHDAIDIGDFPHLVSSNWQSIFARSMQSSDRSRLFLIRDARNDASHPGSGDMERDSVTARLTDIADVLRNIGASEEARAVQGIRDGLSGAAQRVCGACDARPQRGRGPGGDQASEADCKAAGQDNDAAHLRCDARVRQRSAERIEPGRGSDAAAAYDVSGRSKKTAQILVRPSGCRCHMASRDRQVDRGSLPFNYVSRGAHRPYVSG